MTEIQIKKLKERVEAILPILNELQRRLYLAAEAKAIGYGGKKLISDLFDISQPTLRRGLKELEELNSQETSENTKKIRRKGGGRKPKWEEQPGILEALKNLVEPYILGDPMSHLTWVSKSLMKLSNQLTDLGYEVSHSTVKELLKKLGYTKQANKKTLTVKESDPDRNEQFEYINNKVNEAHEGEINPVISVDAKKKENVGNFKNNGKTYQEKGNPTEVLDHDFPIEELGKVAPYGIYDVFENRGFVNVGISKETAVFAVESIRRWWNEEGEIIYPQASEIIITADCGGSNGNRIRLWKWELQKFANETGITIRVMHYPPGTSKWNKIEHRLFSFISIAWGGIPLTSLAVILSLINSTTTESGLYVSSTLDGNTYETGIKITDEQLATVNLVPDEFHGEWNYRIFPNLSENRP